MDLKAARAQLAEKEPLHNRIRGELDRVRAAIVNASQLARDTQLRAKESAIQAVIAGTAEAQAEAAQAKAAMTAAYEEETVLKDQVNPLDLALGQVQAELFPLRASIKKEEERIVAEAITARRQLALDALHEAAASWLVAAFGTEPIVGELGRLVADRVEGHRFAIVERAMAIRAAIRKEVLP